MIAGHYSIGTAGSTDKAAILNIKAQLTAGKTYVFRYLNSFVTTLSVQWSNFSINKI